MRKPLVILLIAVLCLTAYTEYVSAAWGGEGAWGSIVNYLKVVGTHIIPSVDSTFDLGSTAKKWKNAYIDTTFIGDGTFADATPSLGFKDTDSNVGYMFHLESGVGAAPFQNFQLWRGTYVGANFNVNPGVPLMWWDNSNVVHVPYGLSAGSTSQFSVNSDGDVDTTGTLGAGAITQSAVDTSVNYLSHTIQTTGAWPNYSRIAIGTLSYTYDNSREAIIQYPDGGGQLRFRATTIGDIGILTSGTDKMTLTGNGHLLVNTTDDDGTPPTAQFVVKGSTNDGSTNIFVGRDSDEVNVATLDTNGVGIFNGGLATGGTTATARQGIFSVGGASTDNAYFFYDNADVGDTTDGQSVYVYRRAAEGDDYLRFYVNQWMEAQIYSDRPIYINSDLNIFNPVGGGGMSTGDGSDYWNDISYKTLTDRGCLGFFDDGVELRDGRKVSDVEAIKAIQKHPTKKTIYGVPMLDYKTFPKVSYKLADKAGVLLPRDENDEPIGGQDGIEMTSVFSIMLGSIKELDVRVSTLEQENRDLKSRLDKLEQATK